MKHHGSIERLLLKKIHLKSLHFFKFPERLAAEARVAVARLLSILTFKSRVHLALWNNFLSTRSLQTLNVSHKFLGNFKALNKGLSCIFIKHPFSFHSFLFAGDRERFSLPDDMPVMHFEYTQFYYPGDMEFPREYTQTYSIVLFKSNLILGTCTVSRAAQNFWGLNFQTHNWSLAHNMTAYQVLSPSWDILPYLQSPKELR